MVDISVTAASVVKATDANVGSGTAGETITAGQPVYQDSTDGNELKACTTASAAAADCVGISLHASLDGQPLDYVKSGNMTFNAVLTAGETYRNSDNAGGIAPSADAGAGDFSTDLGKATSTTNLKVSINASGVAHG